VQSKVAMTNKENANSSATCYCTMGPLRILEILAILALVIFLVGFIYTLARCTWIQTKIKKDGERKANEDKLVKEIEKRFGGSHSQLWRPGKGIMIGDHRPI